MNTPYLIKNKLKMKAIITNAKAFLGVQKEFQSFDSYIWSFVDFKPIAHTYQASSDVPSFDELSTRISHDLKKTWISFCRSYNYLFLLTSHWYI